MLEALLGAPQLLRQCQGPAAVPHFVRTTGQQTGEVEGQQAVLRPGHQTLRQPVARFRRPSQGQQGTDLGEPGGAVVGLGTDDGVEVG